MIKVGIVEDEFLIAMNVYRTLEELGYHPLEPVANYSDAIDAIELHKPDIMLLDIQLAGRKDGIELAERIKNEYELPFIFLTANADSATVERAKKLNPPAYLVKPFSKDDLYSAIEICLYNYSGQKCLQSNEGESTAVIAEDCLFIKVNQYFHKVKIDDIFYVAADDNYINVFTEADRFFIRNTLQNFLELLNNRNFIRVHRSYVVNVRKITIINTERIYLGNFETPVGKAFRETLLERLKVI